MNGRNIGEAPIGDFPIPYDRIQPGDYWKVLTRDGSRPLNVLENPDDRRYWGSSSDTRYDSNLTGGVWGIMTPNRLYGMLSIHTVREEEDGTISVRPGDGSSNSILVQGAHNQSWHGYMEHGVWSEC